MASLIANTRAMLALCLGLVLTFALALGFQGPTEALAQKSAAALCPKCNVVLISFDTLRADHVGAYGYDRRTTPNVDKLAARSIVFDNAIAQAPWTLPSHGSMFSGLYPGRLGVTRYPANRRLPNVGPVLAEELKAAGYATVGFTGGGFVARHYGFDRGFDIYGSQGRRFEPNVTAANEWLTENKKKRFFMFLHGYDAHRPYYSTPPDKAVMGLTDKSLAHELSGYCYRNNRARPSDERLEQVISYYDAAIHHGDKALAPFFETLDELDLTKNTIVILTSDHGEEFYEHGNCDHVRFVYKEVVHVPLMIHVPGFAKSGSHESGLVPASISIPRTVLDLVGVENSMPGVSLLPILKGESWKFPFVYSHADTSAGSLGSRGPAVSITTASKKLIMYTDEGTSEGYNLVVDPTENEVLSDEDDVYALRNTLRAWYASLTPLPKPPPIVSTPGEEVKRRQRRTRRRAARARALHGSRGETDDSKKKPAQGKEKADPMKLPADVRRSLKALGYIED